MVDDPRTEDDPRPDDDRSADEVAFADLVGSHGGPDRLLLRITDEELAVVSGDLPDHGEAVALRALDGLSDDAFDAVLGAARRSLAARDLVDAGPGPSGGVTLREELAIVTGARRAATAVSAASRSTPDGPASMGVYALEGGCALVDQVVTSIHHFHLVDGGDAVTGLATFLDPEGVAAAEDGEVLEGPADRPPPGWDTVLDQVGDGASTFTARRDGQVNATAFLPTPQGLWVVGALTPDPPAGAGAGAPSTAGAAGAATAGAAGATAVGTMRAVQLGVTSLLTLLAGATGLAPVVPDDEPVGPS